MTDPLPLRAHHIAIRARDLDASLALYRDLLGMTVAAEFGQPEEHVFLLAMDDGSHIELLAPKAGTPQPGDPAANDPVIHVALATPDVRAAIETVRAAGYAVTMEPREHDFNRFKAMIAFFTGPNGESIEFIQAY